MRSSIFPEVETRVLLEEASKEPTLEKSPLNIAQIDICPLIQLPDLRLWQLGVTTACWENVGPSNEQKLGSHFPECWMMIATFLEDPSVLHLIQSCKMFYNLFFAKGAILDRLCESKKNYERAKLSFSVNAAIRKQELPSFSVPLQEKKDLFLLGTPYSQQAQDLLRQMNLNPSSSFELSLAREGDQELKQPGEGGFVLRGSPR